jgi:hypothetical protein
MADEILDVFTPNWPDISSAAATWADTWWGGLPKPVVSGSRTQSDQWLRRMELIVYSSKNKDALSPDDGLALSNLRVNFQVKKQTLSSPNILYARIYNMSPQTMARVKSFSRVALSAGYWGSQGDPAIYLPDGDLGQDLAGGYGGNYGMIFDGTVVLYIQGKENAVDTYLDIWAGDGDKESSAGAINMTFPAGTKMTDKTEKIAKEGFKIEIGKINILDERASVRAETVIGMVEPQLRKIANQSDTHFWIDSNKFYMVPYTGYADDTEVVLKPTTGLIGMPLVQPDGIQVQCLLNSKLRIGGKLKIDTGLLSNVPFEPGSDSPYWNSEPQTLGATGPEQKWQFAPTSPQGTYKILLLEHHGDNRGQNWYSNITAMAVGEFSDHTPIFASTAFSRSAVGLKLPDNSKPGNPATQPMNSRVRALAARMRRR